MTLVNITGTLTDSVGNVIEATIDVTLDTFRASTGTAFMPINYQFTVTAGVIDIDVPSSEQSYTWIITSGGIQLLSFRAGVPDQPTLDFNDLLPTGYTPQTIDTGLIRLADFLVNDPTRLAKITPNFDSKGTYNPATTYFLNDTVDYLGSSYYWKSQEPGAGYLPTNTTYWQLLAEKGNTGASTTGEDFVYDPVTWNSVLAAPSKNSVRDLIETDIRVNFAPVDNPTFTGNPAAPTPIYTSNDTRVATTAHVWSALDPLIDYAADPLQPRVANLNTVTDNSTKIPNTKWVQDVILNNLSGVKIKSASFNQSLSWSSFGTGASANRSYVFNDHDSNSWVELTVGGVDILFHWAYLQLKPTSGTFTAATTYYVAKLPISASFQKSINGNMIFQSCQVANVSHLALSNADEVMLSATAYWANTNLYYYGLNDFVLYMKTGSDLWTSNLWVHVFFICTNYVAI